MSEQIHRRQAPAGEVEATPVEKPTGVSSSGKLARDLDEVFNIPRDGVVPEQATNLAFDDNLNLDAFDVPTQPLTAEEIAAMEDDQKRWDEERREREEHRARWMSQWAEELLDWVMDNPAGYWSPSGLAEAHAGEYDNVVSDSAAVLLRMLEHNLISVKDGRLRLAKKGRNLIRTGRRKQDMPESRLNERDWLDDIKASMGLPFEPSRRPEIAPDTIEREKQEAVGDGGGAQ